MFGKILPCGNNPDSVKPALANNSHTRTHLFTRSCPNLRPRRYSVLDPESPREPLSYWWLRRRVTIHLILSWMLLFYLEVILKRCSSLSPQQKRQAERPLGNILFRRRQILYSTHTQACTYKLQIYERGIFVLYFSLVAAERSLIFSRMILF